MQEEISLLLQRDHFNLAVLAKSQAALIFTSANSFGESACIAVQQLRAVSTSTSAVSKISVHRCTFITSLHTFHRSEMKNYSCLVQTILHTFGVRLGRLLHFFFCSSQGTFFRSMQSSSCAFSIYPKQHFKLGKQINVDICLS